MEQQKINALWTPLHWLSVLAQQGSYTAAAARLGVSKAAMSQRIAELDRAAKVTLVLRTTRSLRLTEAGQKLVDDTRASFEQIEQSFAQVRDLAEQPSGLIQALRLLKNVEGISIVELDTTDVIRHKLVKAIIERYETTK